jgi:hypothetical protein
MVDKLTTVSRSRLGQRIGQLADDDLLRLNRLLLVFFRAGTLTDQAWSLPNVQARLWIDHRGLVPHLVAE